jgi:hypothetical protein
MLLSVVGRPNQGQDELGGLKHGIVIMAQLTCSFYLVLKELVDEGKDVTLDPLVPANSLSVCPHECLRLFFLIFEGLSLLVDQSVWSEGLREVNLIALRFRDSVGGLGQSAASFQLPCQSQEERYLWMRSPAFISFW